MIQIYDTHNGEGKTLILELGSLIIGCQIGNPNLGAVDLEVHD